MHIGILREKKNPPDRRVAFTPVQVQKAQREYPELVFSIEPSSLRCFKDEEYMAAGAHITSDLSHCDVLFGVKEVPQETLLPGKTYFFFSHTIKKQEYNRSLLQSVLRKRIELIDYECLVDTSGQRLVAFGRWAGIVGAYNGLRAWSLIHDQEDLRPCHEMRDYSEVLNFLKDRTFEPLRITVSGDGRVAQGVWELLEAAKIPETDPLSYLKDPQVKPVFVKLKTIDLYRHKSGHVMNLQDYFKNPGHYTCRFKPYISSTDLFINAIYWHPDAPVFFTSEDMKKPDFNIRAIADITCDIHGSVPATLRATTIEKPFMGVQPMNLGETEPFQEDSITVMSVDNLPNELPVNASETFGEALLTHVIPDLLGKKQRCSDATIARNGVLTPRFSYLQSWVDPI